MGPRAGSSRPEIEKRTLTLNRLLFVHAHPDDETIGNGVTMARHVAEGGHLVLAGILERQTDELKAAYAPYLQLDVADTEDGWVLMTARRAADSATGTGR